MKHLNFLLSQSPELIVLCIITVAIFVLSFVKVNASLIATAMVFTTITLVFGVFKFDYLVSKIPYNENATFVCTELRETFDEDGNTKGNEFLFSTIAKNPKYFCMPSGKLIENIKVGDTLYGQLKVVDGIVLNRQFSRVYIPVDTKERE